MEETRTTNVQEKQKQYKCKSRGAWAHRSARYSPMRMAKGWEVDDGHLEL